MADVVGDEALGARLQRRLGPKHRVFAAATVSGDAMALAGVGTTLDADFEIGSISKAITGLLYVDSLERGELDADTRLGEVLPLGDCAASEVTLASLSTHSSGLPRLPRSAAPLRRTLSLWVRGTNPYGEDLEQLLGQARTVRVSSHRPRYSNIGFELLGHAVAACAGMSYRQLVRDRIARPLNLTSLETPRTAADLGPDSIMGTSRSGRSRQPWTGEALAPAGGLRSSIRDMGRLTQALLDGSAPGRSALAPVQNLSGPAVRIGAGWITLELKGRPITWHNGGTGGFRTWIGIHQPSHSGAVLLTATSSSVDRHGFSLLQELVDQQR